MIQQGQQLALELFQLIAERLDSKLKTPIRTFFLSLLTGALLAIARRRTVTKWIQAAGLSEQYRNIFVTVHALRVLPACSVWSQDYFVAVFGNKLGGDRP